MSHFNPSHLKFYLIAISSVVILCTVVNTYGENNLKAPQKIGGVYKIESEKLPNCLKERPLQLTLQQSGIYINGSLQATKDKSKGKSTSEENLPLKGRLQDGKISIVGAITQVDGCDRTQPLTITATVTGKRLEGKIAFLNNTSDFTAQLQEPDAKATVNH
jgi:hypothetical protein